MIKIGKTVLGGPKIALIAGPCAVESLEQTMQTAHFLQSQGVSVFRAGAFKPRTNPTSFQGLGEQGLEILARVKKETGLLICTEVMDARQIPAVSRVADLLQVGARNMQNYDLLRELGRQEKPVLLKNGLAATVDELIGAGEYVLQGGNTDLIYCLRGIRTFETRTRFAFDPALVEALKNETKRPVIVDPSHSAGRRDLVYPIARAAVAVGADGLLVEVHPDPTKAKSDAEQQLDFGGFERLLAELRPIAQAVGRTL
ncbi:MAG: 3-deoxy-7-phosphoheptulonate synthase [Candidatus Diapherotrites archaeon]|nr:3-deoxy-7-phosphoheptulonate synthase [Candidatus Diapherotrites archaeon]